MVSAINTWAVSVMRYGAGIINWNKAELQRMDRKTRKTMTLYGMHHPAGNVDRLYLPRKIGGRGLMSIEEAVRAEEKGLYCYVKESHEPLICMVIREKTITNLEEETAHTFMKRRNKEKENGWKNKALHGQFSKLTGEIMDQKSWSWVRKGGIKKETEGTIFAAQEQALRTNAIKKRIDGQDISPLCRMCGEREEIIAHIVSECSKMAQKQYKEWRHDKVAQIVHWKICEKHKIERGDKWYEHKTEKVIETDEIKLLWDFPIQTDHKLEHNKPDLVYIDKRDKKCKIIDVACPFDGRISKKEREKIEYYQDLKREIKRLWDIREVIIIPIIIGALGTINCRFEEWISRIGIECPTELLQKACLLGRARILRKVLDT